MNVLFYLISIPFALWLIVSPIIVVRWFFFCPDERLVYSRSHSAIAKGIYIGAFISFVAVVWGGIQNLLFFVPDDWGTFDEDGEFTSVKSMVAGVAALVLGFFIVHVLDRYEKMRSQNEAHRILAEAEKRVSYLSNCSLDDLKEKKEVCLLKREELQQKHSGCSRSPDDRFEIEVLSNVINTIGSMIKEEEQRILFEDD